VKGLVMFVAKYIYTRTEDIYQLLRKLYIQKSTVIRGKQRSFVVRRTQSCTKC